MWIYIVRIGRVKKLYEFIYYITVGAGLAIATASFTMMSGLSTITNGFLIPLAVIVGGLGCIYTAFCVGKLAKKYPGTSGIRTYLKKGLGDKQSLFLVYLYLFFIILAGGIESHLFAKVIQSVFPDFPILLGVFLSFGTILVVNLVGIEVPRAFQIVITLLLISVLFGVASIGLFKVGTLKQSSDFLKDVSFKDLQGFPSAIAMAFFLFVGFEWVTPLGFSRKSYTHMIPRSMIVAVSLGLIINVIFITSLNVHVPKSIMASTSIPQVAYCYKLWGVTGKIFALSFSTLAILSTFNAGMTGGSRLLYSLAREEYLFKGLQKITPSGLPFISIIVLTVIAALFSIISIVLMLELIAAITGSAIICLIYAALIFSMTKLVIPKEKKFLRIVNRFIALLFIVLGTISLFSETSLGMAPLLFLIILLILAQIMTLHFYNTKNKNLQKVSLQHENAY